MRHLQRAIPKATHIPKKIQAAFKLINAPLYSVEERIAAQAREFDPAVEGYVAYACESSGKRLRPALALLAGGATGNIGNPHMELAVILELIHAATLVHDDIMDGADIRRGEPTTNAKWGNTISVLLGDAMFAHALKLSTSFTSTEITRRIANASVDVCSGEIIQTQRRFDLKLSVPDYLRIIEMKTATLFAAATELGALINETSPEVIGAMKTFGLSLGIAYQIYDDCLDIVGDESRAGKTLGSDLKKGKLTLPILHLLQNCTESDRARWNNIILSGEDVTSLVEAVNKRGSLQFAIGSARNHLSRATASLAVIPSNRFQTALRQICESVDDLLGQFA